MSTKSELAAVRGSAVAVRKYMAQHKVSNAQARAALGLPPKNKKGGGGKAMVPWTGAVAAPVPQTVYVQIPQQRKRRAPARENIVPTMDGTDVTTKAGVALHAAIYGHTPVEFDKRAIAAILTGFIDQARNGNAVDLAAIFPHLSTEKHEKMEALRRENAQEHKIGVEEYKLLGAACMAHDVTEAEWVTFYRAAKASAVGMRVAPPVIGGPAQQQGEQGVLPFGSPLAGQPAVTDPFGVKR